MSTALKLVDTAMPDRLWWQTTQEQAAVLVKSGFLPTSIKTPEQATAIMMKGRELGVPPMYALSNIYTVNGKPTCSAELMLALIYRDQGDTAIEIVDSSNDRCVVSYKRRGWAESKVFEWSIKDAAQAGLTGKDGPWKAYPAAMLRARCLSAVARMAFPDSIGGMYTPEELGADVYVADDGSVEVVSPPLRIQGPEITASVEVVDQETGEIVEADAPEDEGVTFAEGIANSTTQDELVAIGRRMSNEKYTDRATWAAFNKRKLEIAKQNRAAQDTAALGAANASEQSPLLDAARTYEHLGQ